MPSTVPPAQILLSPMERLFQVGEDNLAGALRVTILVRLAGCAESGLLERALLDLQRRHPRLRARIVRGEDSASFEILSAPAPIPFTLQDYEGEPPWQQEAYRLMWTPFPEEGPLAAVAVLRDRAGNRCDLLLTAHHAIADGVSAITLADDLLTAYARAEQEPEAPPCESLAMVTARRAKGSGWRNHWRLVRRLIRVQQEERRTSRTPLPSSDAPAVRSQWAHWVYSREDTLALVRNCRRERTSLGAALKAALLCGLADCLSLDEAVFKCTFPFDVREALKGSAGAVTVQDTGCFASLMIDCYRIHRQPSFWDVARHAHQNHTQFLEQGGPAFNYNLAAAMAWLFRLAMLHRKVTRPPNGSEGASGRSTLLATYYGVTHLQSSYGTLRPVGCTLTLNNAVVGPELVLEGLVMSQQLNAGLTGDQLHPAFWEALQAATRRYIAAAVGRDGGMVTVQAAIGAGQSTIPFTG